MKANDEMHKVGRFVHRQISPDILSLIVRLQSKHERMGCSHFMKTLCYLILWDPIKKLLDMCVDPGQVGLRFMSRVGGQSARFVITCFLTGRSHMFLLRHGHPGIKMCSVPLEEDVHYMFSERPLSRCETRNLHASSDEMISAALCHPLPPARSWMF
jgi:hypothetical protein